MSSTDSAGRVLAYCRVSTDEQEKGTSLDTQRAEIAEHCRSVGLPEPEFFVEVESAGEEKLAKRLELNRLMTAARAGDLVIVAKQDRWTRSTLHFLQSTSELTKRGVRFFSLAERFDPTLPEGKMASVLMAMVGEQEKARTRARTIQGRKAKRREGKHVEGPVPFGYVRREGKLEIVPEEAEKVREIYRLCLDGLSWVRIAKRVGRGQSSVGWILSNRAYTGELETESGLWLVTHDPIVSKSTWLQAQAKMADRQRGGRPASGDARTSSWLLRAMGRCAECGRVFSASYGRLETSDYYVCTGRLKRSGCTAERANRVDSDELIARMVLDRLTELREELARPVRASKAGSLEPQRKRLRKKRENLIDLGVDGMLTKEELRVRLAKLDDELAALVDPPSAPKAADLRFALALVEKIREAWGKATVDERREILSLLTTKIVFQAGEAVVEWAPTERLLREK